MVVQLDLTNGLREPFVLNSESATGQLVQPGQNLQVTFSLLEGPNGVAVLHLYVDPSTPLPRGGG